MLADGLAPCRALNFMCDYHLQSRHCCFDQKVPFSSHFPWTEYKTRLNTAWYPQEKCLEILTFSGPVNRRICPFCEHKRFLDVKKEAIILPLLNCPISGGKPTLSWSLPKHVQLKITTHKYPQEWYMPNWELSWMMAVDQRCFPPCREGNCWDESFDYSMVLKHRAPLDREKHNSENSREGTSFTLSPEEWHPQTSSARNDANCCVLGGERRCCREEGWCRQAEISGLRGDLWLCFPRQKIRVSRGMRHPLELQFSKLLQTCCRAPKGQNDSCPGPNLSQNMSQALKE